MEFSVENKLETREESAIDVDPVSGVYIGENKEDQEKTINEDKLEEEKKSCKHLFEESINDSEMLNERKNSASSTHCADRKNSITSFKTKLLSMKTWPNLIKMKKGKDEWF